MGELNIEAAKQATGVEPGEGSEAWFWWKVGCVLYEQRNNALRDIEILRRRAMRAELERAKAILELDTLAADVKAKLEELRALIAISGPVVRAACEWFDESARPDQPPDNPKLEAAVMNYMLAVEIDSAKGSLQ
jgi:hypothetical protein